MRIEICTLSLGEVERLQCDSISIFLFEDTIPLRGLAGIVDWRLNGLISKLLIEGIVHNRMGKNFLMTLRPRLKAVKLFGFGEGSVRQMDLQKASQIVRESFRILEKAGVHSTALMMPGREIELYSIEDGLKYMKEILSEKIDIDQLVIVDRFDDPDKDLKKVMSILKF